MVAVQATTGRRPTALRPIALRWLPSLSVGRLPARQCLGVCLAKAKASGRVDVYTRGSQGSVCLTTPIAGPSRCGYLGFVLGLACGVAYGFALGSTYHECDKRQPRLTTSGSTRQLALVSGCTHGLSVGVRTGGRLHPGQVGERLLKQRPKLFSWASAKTNLARGSELEGVFSALRSFACLPARSFCPCSLFSCSPSPSWFLRGSPRPFVCPSPCLLSSAVLLPSPTPASDLTPSLCMILGTRSEAVDSPRDLLSFGPSHCHQ